MFSGPPLPLPQDFPLQQLIPIINGRERAAVWLCGARDAHQLLISAAGRCIAALIGEDLGALLRCCSQVVIREGLQPRLLDRAELIRWRALQVVTGTPHLPSLEQLKETFPGSYFTDGSFYVPLERQHPEEVLADCLTHGIPVVESRIVYQVGHGA